MNITNNKGQTVLMMACKFCSNDDSYEIIKQLIKNGSDVNITDSEGNTALAYLLMDGQKNIKTVQLLSSMMKNTKQDTNNYRQKYLDFMATLSSKLKPLSGDSYNWQDEFKRVSEYKHWDIMENAIYRDSLNICDSSFNEFPKEIGSLTNLKSIIARNNLLDKLPDEITNLVNLNELVITGNKFTEFPKQILDLNNLIVVSLGGNKIKEIPKEIFKLSNLKAFFMDGNELNSLPREIGELKNLQILDIQENNFDSVSDDIIAKLENLSTLRIRNVQ